MPPIQTRTGPVYSDGWDQYGNYVPSDDVLRDPQWDYEQQLQREMEAAQLRLAQMAQDDAQRKQQMQQQLANMGLNFAGDQAMMQSRLISGEGDILQQQAANARMIQNALEGNQQFRYNQSRSEVPNEWSRAKRLYGY